MRLLRRFLMRLCNTAARQIDEERLNDEIEEHLALETAENIRRGMSPAEARRQARLKFGAVEAVKEDYRDESRMRFIETLFQDLRYGLRTLRKSTGFTAVAVLTLALGIGSNVAIFGVLDGVVLKPLNYPHPEKLVSVELSPLALDPTLRGMAPEDYFVFREQSHTFQDIGIYLETDSDRDVNITGFAEAERVHALNVSDGALSVLNVPAMLGRIFSRSDDSPGAPLTAILTYEYWQRKFSADPGTVGKTIVVDGMAREIIGVMPRNFRFLDLQDLAVILPLKLDRNAIRLGNFSYFGIARLNAESNLAQATADVARMIPITLRSFSPPAGVSRDFLEKARIAPNILPLKQDVVGNVGTLLWILMGGIGMVLLIACANVANLLLVRTEGRQHELALRAALGATRKHIALQLLVESSIIAGRD
jgi:predicted permease